MNDEISKMVRRLSVQPIEQRDPRRLAEALHWRAIERQLRASGMTRRQAMTEVSRRKRLQQGNPQPASVLARFLDWIR